MSKFLRNTVLFCLSLLLLLGGVLSVAAEDPAPAPVTFGVSDGVSDITSFFTQTDKTITGTVPFDTETVNISLSNGTTTVHEVMPLNVGSNTMPLTFGDETYAFVVLREAPEFTFTVKAGDKDLTSLFQMSIDRLISGTVPNNIESLTVTVAHGTVSKSVEVPLTVGAQNSAKLDLTLSSGTYTFNVVAMRAAPDGFTVTHNGKDISSQFTLTDSKLTGTVENDIDQLVVSFRKDGYSDGNGVPYTLVVGTNTYIHELQAGSGKFIYYLTIIRKEAVVSSQASSSSQAESSKVVSSEVSSVVSSKAPSSAAVSSKPTSSGAVGTLSSVSSVKPESQEASSTAENKPASGGFSVLLLLAVVFIVLGVLGILFVVLDTLYTYGILKKWIFRVPQLNENGDTNGTQPETPANLIFTPEEAEEEDLKKVTPDPEIGDEKNKIAEQPEEPVKQEKPKSKDEEWDDFFR